MTNGGAGSADSIFASLMLCRWRIAGMVALIVTVGSGSGTMVLWNPRTGLCDEVPKAAAYALGGALFAATQDVDKWRCEVATLWVCSNPASIEPR